MPPQALLLASSLLWSTGGLLIKLVDWSPLAIAGGRSAFAAATIWLLSRCRPVRWERPVLLGAFVYSATVITFVIATKWSTAANAIFLQFTAPAYVAALGGRFLGEQTSRADWVRVLAAQCGILLFFLDGLTLTGMLGNAVGLLSGFCFAGLIICLRRQKDADPVDSVLLGNILTFVVCSPFLFTGEPSGKTVFGLGILGVFQLGLAYFLYSKAIKQMAALPAILIGMIEPILNPIWVLLFVGERPGRGALAGGTIVIGAALSQSLAAARRHRPMSPLPPD